MTTHAPDSPAPRPVPQGPWLAPGVVVITGIQAAGKSTVAQALAERLPKAVHLRGDGFRRNIVSGQVGMTPDAGEEALAQLRLRHRLTAHCADEYARAGFTVIVQDILLGEHLAQMTVDIATRPLAVVALLPDPEAVAAREADRPKTAYGPDWSVRDLDALIRTQTPRDLGLWLDTSRQTVPETVDTILARAWTQGAVA
ncbi:AAA family ATPase [Streptomyces sp. NPDC057743]|uniref:AAA family ATPase n=1 Tax=Streptomyces sp. NPDC057743 TaxID=3346236 RepID=UPI003673D4D7